jgi:hypothetical protein
VHSRSAGIAKMTRHHPRDAEQQHDEQFVLRRPCDGTIPWRVRGLAARGLQERSKGVLSLPNVTSDGGVRRARGCRVGQYRQESALPLRS